MSLRALNISPSAQVALLWVAACLTLWGGLTSRLHADVQERGFYEVLDDVLGDFEFDVKSGNVTGLKDLSVRNVVVSENVPSSFATHLELLITQKILKNSKTRMIQCLQCKGKRTTVSGDQVVITSAETNQTELARIAKLSNIAHFLDTSFSYQPNSLVVSMSITEPETGTLIWTRMYNSETSRAAALRRGTDYSDIGDTRKATEYSPTLQYRVALDFLMEPNIGGPTGCVGVAFRMVERYDNRKKEVGFEFDYLKDGGSLNAGPNAAAVAGLYSGVNVTLVLVHAWNLLNGEENFNKVRGSFNVGIGGTYSSGYLGSLFRVGYEWRLGSRFTVSALVGYRPASTVLLPTSTTGGNSVSGLEYGGGINFLF